MTFFTDIHRAPDDAVFAVSGAYEADPAEKKVTLVIGAYRDENGKPVIFDAVKRAGQKIYDPQNAGKYNKEYLPMGGNPEFRRLTAELIFGHGSKALAEKRVATIQALSGTGALAVCGLLLRKTLPMETFVYVSDPTWPNHECIYGEACGFTVKKYRYWDKQLVGCNISAMLEDLRQAPKRSIIILHACAHNPTGEDPSKEEWHQILETIRDRQHFAILDSAYQGFATQDLDRDAYAIRLFESAGLSFAVCQSFAKNMGLYGERVGALHIVTHSPEEAALVTGRMSRIARTLWSNPPKHGCELALEVLKDAELTECWKKQLAQVSQRITDMRTALFDALTKLGTPGKWDHIKKQIGMFSYTGLTPPQVKLLIEKYHIYLMGSGRISMAGVNMHNVDYIARAIDDAVRHC